MPLTKQEYDEFRSLWEDIKKTLEAHETEIKKTTDLPANLVKMSGEHEQKWQRMETRMGQLEAEANKPPTFVGANFNGFQGRIEYDDYGLPKKNYSPHMDAFMKACHGGVGALTKDERSHLRMANATDAPAVPGLQIKGLTLSEDTTGGFFAPPEFVPEVLKNVVLWSPIRPFARVRNTSARSIQQPRRVSTITAQWVGERQVRTELTGYSLGRVEIPTHEMYGLVLISEQDLEDPVFDLEQFMRDELSEQFGVAEGKSFVVGNSIIQPQGLLKDTRIAIDESKSDGNVTADTLIDSFYNLPEIYVANARWIMNRKSVGLVRKLKYGGGETSYIWQPGAGPSRGGLDSAPANILGLPYTEIPDMPDAGTDSYSIMLGDFARGYTIVDRVGITFKRLNERWVENAQIGIFARKRVGGQVVLPEAMRIIQLGTI